MYCVKCGVKLEEGRAACPLCGTPVWNPGEEPLKAHYNADLYPVKSNSEKYAALSIIAVILLNVCLASLIACLNLYGAAAWSGYIMLACALFYVLFCLPFWFRRFYPAIFLPVDFAAVIGYLLYINCKTGGHWFLSFAFPCVMILFVLTFLATGLARIKFQPHTRLLLVGLYFILLGGATLLVELFQHITFHSPMFLWSLYTVCSFGFLGLFLFIASFIRPLRHDLHKKFFV